MSELEQQISGLQEKRDFLAKKQLDRDSFGRTLDQMATVDPHASVRDHMAQVRKYPAVQRNIDKNAAGINRLGHKIFALEEAVKMGQELAELETAAQGLPVFQEALSIHREEFDVFVQGVLDVHPRAQKPEPKTIEPAVETEPTERRASPQWIKDAVAPIPQERRRQIVEAFQRRADRLRAEEATAKPENQPSPRPVEEGPSEIRWLGPDEVKEFDAMFKKPPRRNDTEEAVEEPIVEEPEEEQPRTMVEIEGEFVILPDGQRIQVSSELLRNFIAELETNALSAIEGLAIKIYNPTTEKELREAKIRVGSLKLRAVEILAPAKWTVRTERLDPESKSRDSGYRLDPLIEGEEIKRTQYKLKQPRPQASTEPLPWQTVPEEVAIPEGEISKPLTLDEIAVLLMSFEANAPLFERFGVSPISELTYTKLAQRINEGETTIITKENLKLMREIAFARFQALVSIKNIEDMESIIDTYEDSDIQEFLMHFAIGDGPQENIAKMLEYMELEPGRLYFADKPWSYQGARYTLRLPEKSGIPQPEIPVATANADAKTIVGTQTDQEPKISIEDQQILTALRKKDRNLTAHIENTVIEVARSKKFPEGKTFSMTEVAAVYGGLTPDFINEMIKQGLLGSPSSSRFAQEKPLTRRDIILLRHARKNIKKSGIEARKYGRAIGTIVDRLMER